MGYFENSKGYRLIDPETKKIKKSRDVIFLENSKPKDEEKSSVTLQEDSVSQDDSEFNQSQKADDDADSETTSEYSESLENFKGIEEAGQPANKPVEDSALRKSTRPHKPVNMEDYVTYLTLSNDVTEPESVEEALNSSDKAKWLEAMEEEQASLIKNETWTPVNLPRDKKALDTKWVFKIKRDATGKIRRYKARLVVRGCGHIEGIDYSETYSPVVRYTSIRFLCALASKYDLYIDQMDMTAAYLHGDIEEEIYVKPPIELAKASQDGKVWKLRKSMYCLKQSDRAWNRKLHNTLLSLGFVRSQADPCVYFKRNDKSLIIIAVYVDDLLILANNRKEKSLLKSKLSQVFDMKDLGEARDLLGMCIVRDRKAGKV